MLLPASASLTLFAWLLTMHPTAWDGLGAAVTLLGMPIIMFAPRGARPLPARAVRSQPKM